MTLWQAVLKDMVQSCSGLQAAEIWLKDPATTRLYRPKGGFFANNRIRHSMALHALAAQANDESVSAHIGVGHVGALWEHAASSTRDVLSELVHLKHLASNDAWLHDARSHHAAAVFEYAASLRIPPASGTSGETCLLIVYANSSGSLQHPRNRAFLAAASGVVAALAATSRPRAKLRACKETHARGMCKAAAAAKNGQLAAALIAASRTTSAPTASKRRRKLGGSSLVGNSSLQQQPPQRSTSQRASSRRTATRDARPPLLTHSLHHGKHAARRYLSKWRGLPGAGPKPVSWRERAEWEACAWAWVGSASTLLVLDVLHSYIYDESDGQYFLMLGSFGALVAILFGAPHSSFAQPRAVLCSNMIAASIAVTVHLLSSPAHLNLIPLRMAIAIAPATAIAVNHRLGLLHPPAGAAALIFVSGGQQITAMGWMYLLVPLGVANVVCVLMATAFNNLSSARQYPLYWLGGGHTRMGDGKARGTSESMQQAAMARRRHSPTPLPPLHRLMTPASDSAAPSPTALPVPVRLPAKTRHGSPGPVRPPSPAKSPVRV